MPRHPWEITLREFVEIVRRNYGIEIDPASAAVAGGWFLSKDRRPYLVPVIGMDDIMSVYLLGYFCRLYRIPPEDFGLPAEEDDWSEDQAASRVSTTGAEPRLSGSSIGESGSVQGVACSYILQNLRGAGE